MEDLRDDQHIAHDLFRSVQRVVHAQKAETHSARLHGVEMDGTNGKMTAFADKIDLLRALERHNDPNDLSIQKSQQFIIDARYKVNQLWTTGGYIRWDTSDRNRLQNLVWTPGMNSVTNGSQGYGIQEYEISATRDLHDFILEFGVNSRHSFVNSANTNKNKMNDTVFVRFTMKGLPISFGQGAGQAPFCAPRIGETVAGANESGGFFDSPIKTGGDSQSLSAR